MLLLPFDLLRYILVQLILLMHIDTIIIKNNPWMLVLEYYFLGMYHIACGLGRWKASRQGRGSGGGLQWSRSTYGGRSREFGRSPQGLSGLGWNGGVISCWSKGKVWRWKILMGEMWWKARLHAKMILKRLRLMIVTNYSIYPQSLACNAWFDIQVVSVL